MSNKFFRIKEVSEMTGVHPQTLRNWEREGLINPIRISGNHRLYTPNDIEQIEEIIRLKDEGLRIKGIQRVMRGKPFIERDEKEKTLTTVSTPISTIKKRRSRRKKNTQYTVEELEQMRLEDLIEIAKRRGIKYFRQMFKDELITAIAYPERELEMTLQAKERTKERYGNKVYGKQKERLLAAQKQEEMEEVLTEKESEEIGLVKSDLPVIEEVEEEGIEQETVIQEILKLGEQGKNAQEIAQYLIQNYKL